MNCKLYGKRDTSFLKFNGNWCNTLSNNSEVSSSPVKVASHLRIRRLYVCAFPGASEDCSWLSDATTETCISSKPWTSRNHSQSVQSEGRPPNAKLRNDLKCGRAETDEGSRMITSFSCGKECSASLNLLGIVDVSLGDLISIDVICFVNKQISYMYVVCMLFVGYVCAYRHWRI